MYRVQAPHTVSRPAPNMHTLTLREKQTCNIQCTVNARTGRLDLLGIRGIIEINDSWRNDPIPHACVWPWLQCKQSRGRKGASTAGGLEKTHGGGGIMRDLAVCFELDLLENGQMVGFLGKWLLF